MEYGCEPGWVPAVYGILLLIVGYLLWSGTYTLEMAFGAVIFLWGAKKLVTCYGGNYTKPRRRR